MATEPVVYRVGQNEYPTTGGSGELLAEQGETIPYPNGAPLTASMGVSAWPPPGFVAPETTVTTTSSLQANLPEPEDVAWVQGDTAEFSWIVADVFWTDDDPGIVPGVDDPDTPEWIPTEWASEVRNPYIASTYRADYWVPAYGFQYDWWRRHSLLGEFTVTGVGLVIPDTDPVRYGTLVTITLGSDVSATILPGVYRFDVQSLFTDTDPQIKRTRIGGRARVVTDWTLV